MSLPTTNSDDPLAPFPTILLTARTIISHILAQPRHVKAYEVLSIPLLEHLMDLFVHVNLVDQRMDDLERQFGLGIVDENELKKRQDKERETKNKVFSWTMLIKGIVSVLSCPKPHPYPPHPNHLIASLTLSQSCMRLLTVLLIPPHPPNLNFRLVNKLILIRRPPILLPNNRPSIPFPHFVPPERGFLEDEWEPPRSSIGRGREVV